MSPSANVSAPSAPDLEAMLDLRAAALPGILREAGAIARAGFDSPDAVFELKGPQDFLTATDAAVEEYLRGRLGAQFESDDFYGEEGGGHLGQSVWIVDPIDGTANFARRIPHYCIAIAYVFAGETRLGGIYDPSRDELYLARKGQGASRNGKPISVSGTDRFESATIEMGWSRRVSTEVYLRTLSDFIETGFNVRRAATGALGLAYVADGRSDGYVELHMQPWDCLAGLLIVREAGGHVGNFEGGGKIQGGGPVLASNAHLSRTLSEISGIDLA